ncbi:MAG: hypothetical protein NTW79_02470 [Candidatus Berkelbacteria bacterium]|nr:hypothetical protein [Candidatus Berkelbacteria bacterium]
MKMFWKILIAVVLTIAVVGGGTYYYMQRKLTNDKNNLQSQINDLNKQISDIKSSPTFGWKTYTNSTEGFGVKIPADWVTQVDGKNLSINSPENQAVRNKIDSGGMYGEGYSPTIMIQYFSTVSDYVNQGSPQPKSTKTFYEFIRGDNMNTNLNEITLGGKKAYEYEAGGFAGTYYNIACEYQSAVFSVQIASEKKSLTDTEKIILSTFQFTK